MPEGGHVHRSLEFYERRRWIYFFQKMQYNGTIMSMHVAKNAAFLTLASVGQKAIALVYFLFVARIMMPEKTGEYFLALSITVIFTVVADLGVTPVVIREIAKDPLGAKQMLSRALALKIPLLFFASALSIFTGAALGYDQSLRALIALACIVLSLDALHLLFYGVLRGLQLLKFESTGVFFGQMITGIVGGIFLWLSPSLPGLIVALICGSLVNFFISLLQVVRFLGVKALCPVYDRTDMKQVAKAALPFALSSIFVKVYSYLDSILISKFLDTASVGIYSVAYRFTYAFQFLPLAFVASLYPGMSAVVGKDPEALKRIFFKSMWYMALLAVPIVFGLFALAQPIVLLTGEEYLAAAPILQALVFVLIPIFLDFPIGSLLNASGRQSTKTAIMGGTMLINVVLNWFLIPRFGVLGAAYAALVSLGFMFAAGLYFVPKLLPTFRFRDLGKILFPLFFSGCVMFASILLLQIFIPWFLLILIGAMIYISSLFVTKSLCLNDIRLMIYAFKKNPSSHS